MTITEAFNRFGTWATNTSPLYAQLAPAVPDDPFLRDLATSVPDDLARPYVFFAAVHDTLLQHPDHDLARFYASVDDNPHEPTEADPVPAFRRFCHDHEATIRGLCTTRRPQTNEVRRCAALLPGFTYIADQVAEPFSLIEIGPSAGLNLLWDRYHYHYEGYGTAGPHDSQVTIESTIDGGNPPIPETMPAVRERIGVDVNPLDVTDSADVRWLKALTWPEHERRRSRLEDAVAVAQENPPALAEGDAVEALPTLVDNYSDPVVIYGTQVLWELPPLTVQRLLNILETVADSRDIHVLFGERGGIDWVLSDREVDGNKFPIELEWTSHPPSGFSRLGSYEIHGSWIRWNNRRTGHQISG